MSARIREKRRTVRDDGFDLLHPPGERHLAGAAVEFEPMVLMVRPPGAEDDTPADEVESRLRVRNAAMPLFTARGYDATSVDDIAMAAGISRRTFFRLFDGKHQVVSCDHERYHEAVVGELERRRDVRTEISAAAALSIVLEGFAAQSEAARVRDRIVASSTLLQAEELRRSARYRRSIADFLRDGRRTAFDAEFIAGGLVAASESVLREWVQGNGQADPAQTFRDQVSARQGKVPGGTAVLIESGLSLDEVRKRLGLH